MNQKIFVMEDDALTADQLQKFIVAMGYEVAGRAKSAEEGMVQIRQVQPDLVLMDIKLKGPMDGIEAAHRLRAENAAGVIFLTAYSDDELLTRARLAEPFGYLVKPISLQALKASIEMALVKRQMEQRLQGLLDAVIRAITDLVKLHDPLLNEVQVRAATLAEAIARELQLPAAEVKGIRTAALLHGLGLIGIPAALFRCLTPLEGVEKTLFQIHPDTAWRVLKDLEFGSPVAEMVHQHMERLDGSGFPRGLRGEALLPGARIVAVACRVAKLLTPYGLEPPLSVGEAQKKIESGSGVLFDAPAVAACARLFRDQHFTLSP